MSGYVGESRGLEVKLAVADAFGERLPLVESE